MTKQKAQKRFPKRVWILVASIFIVLIAGIAIARHVYYLDLRPVNDNQTTQIFTVESGSSVKQISHNLETAHLIRSAWALELYVHSKELGNSLQAGTYALSPSQGTASIVHTLSRGKVTTQLVTILPGRRIDQVRADLINSGFTPASVEEALQPSQYADLPVLAFKPANVDTLEGLLWPDSYQKDPTTLPNVIIRESLTAMGQHLTPDVQAAFAEEGLTTYQGVILASIVTQEVSNAADQAQVAQVFLSRLQTGMMLGSDPTAKYGAILVGRTPSLTFDSAYNTALHTGLPPTPISTITAKALHAATHPASTQWLYFVSGDDGITHFSTNLQDHESQTQQYCKKLCSQ